MTQHLELPGGRIAYDVTGDGPLVVLLPGMGDVRAVYRRLAPELAAAGYRIATADLRGHGESSADWDAYDNAAAGRDLAALIRHLGGPATVVGHSFSGGTAVWLAAEHPELVDGVVLLEAFTRPVAMNPLTRGLARVILSSTALWAMYYRSLHKGPKPADFADHLKAVRAGTRGRMRAVTAIGLNDKASLAGRLSRVTAPALIVMGGESPDFKDPRAEAATIAGELGGDSRTLVIEGAGHYPHTEFPAETAAAVLDFLAGRRAEAA
ncbi:alpha/beta hydrolase [Actinomadura kijaniata]|uniref:Pimeloyl-ACP methyl ester carboxylesterase n=1 Tax=Actinomadura namibiensis TaxID=182080 RepID=A0A7W3LJQ5_ACTNM|nr:alpha/beta hydrolase [Actinomadura namibiensis]MBA8949414.1 pimeloyl-ACP methyl ester carboxylesterase [Actinomadura namibiensis]